MPLTFTGHAQERLSQRGISREDVETALNRPTGRTIPGEWGSIWVFGHDASGRILKVCVATDDRNRVITAARP